MTSLTTQRPKKPAGEIAREQDIMQANNLSYLANLVRLAG